MAVVGAIFAPTATDESRSTSYPLRDMPFVRDNRQTTNVRVELQITNTGEVIEQISLPVHNPYQDPKVHTSTFTK